jgi:hypothetical protein
MKIISTIGEPPVERKQIIGANQPRFESYKTTVHDVSRQVAIARRTGYYIRER